MADNKDYLDTTWGALSSFDPIEFNIRAIENQNRIIKGLKTYESVRESLSDDNLANVVEGAGLVQTKPEEVFLQDDSEIGQTLRILRGGIQPGYNAITRFKTYKDEEGHIKQVAIRKGVSDNGEGVLIEVFDLTHEQGNIPDVIALTGLLYIDNKTGRVANIFKDVIDKSELGAPILYHSGIEGYGEFSPRDRTIAYFSCPSGEFPKSKYPFANVILHESGHATQPLEPSRHDPYTILGGFLEAVSSMPSIAKSIFSRRYRQSERYRTPTEERNADAFELRIIKKYKDLGVDLMAGADLSSVQEKSKMNQSVYDKLGNDRYASSRATISLGEKLRSEKSKGGLMSKLIEKHKQSRD